MNVLRVPRKPMGEEHPSLQSPWICHSLSEQGVRENNEDRAGAVRLPSGGDILLYVADGAGGHLAGERASETAEHEIVEATQKQEKPLAVSELPLFVGAIFHAAQEKLQVLDTLPEMSGLGTTLTLLMTRRDQICVGHIGDTRAWLFRKGTLHQLTQDHSDPIRRNRLLRALCAQHSTPDIFASFSGAGAGQAGAESRLNFRVQRGDVFLVTSDGLHGVVSHRQMETLLKSAVSVQEAAERLVYCAHQSESRDNISLSIAANGHYPRPANAFVRYGAVVGLTLMLGMGLGTKLRQSPAVYRTASGPTVERRPISVTPVAKDPLVSPVSIENKMNENKMNAELHQAQKKNTLLARKPKTVSVTATPTAPAKQPSERHPEKKKNASQNSARPWGPPTGDASQH